MTRILRGLMAASLIVSAAWPTHAASTNATPESLKLQDCIDLALRQNPTILKAREEIRRNQGVIVEVRAQAVPQITASGSYQQVAKSTLDSIPAPGFPSVFDNQEQPWTAQIQISQLVYSADG